MIEISKLIPGISEVVPHLYDELTQKEVFEPMFEQMLSSVTRVERPTLVHMLGIPGCGKSTFIKQNMKKFENYLIISFDDIMESIPQYHEDVLKLGSVEAFKKWEIPARIAGYELLIRAINKKVNILFDHGGSPACHVELMKNVGTYCGYKTAIYELSCPVDVAIRRVKVREMRTKRHTPENMIRQRYELLKNRGFEYMAIVNEYHVVSSSRHFNV